ncbi:neuronal membrane glycoprotein M6-b-like [Pseudoliparis swirei]|uniref:neuronal membrane glycoprotein M6-b-like n=1 Tax=Pseudoliparis swirei TaxID=2059687 RepID=UPI0024BE764F|nr:neuronal membrane glycoprotein M6-b-like [Pseudoliparis swirei]
MDGTKPAMESNAEETQEEGQDSKGCFECCIKCLGGVPYASLVATILCFSGVALFCGCGHVALTGTLTMLENHFSRVATDHATLATVIEILQDIIYGVASFFFVYAIVLLAEGFYTTSAIKKELQSDFKTTVCGRCITAFFMFLTYVLALAFLAIFGFSAIPVFLFFNMWNTCAAMKSPDGNITSPDSICVDVRQYGIIPWNATPGKACGATLGDICNTSEFYLSYHLYIVAFAGAGATVIALIHYLMILGANWAYLKSAVSTHEYQDIKTKDDQDLEAEARSKEGQNSSSYS